MPTTNPTTNPTSKTRANAKKHASKRQKKGEEKFRVTPKGLFYLCLTDAFKCDFDDRIIAVAWELFEARMRKNGYITED